MKDEDKKFALASKQIPTVNSGWLDRELGEAMTSWKHPMAACPSC